VPRRRQRVIAILEPLMPTMLAMKRLVAGLAMMALSGSALAQLGAPGPASSDSALREPTRTQNVVLVMIDGLRWQEVFRGADEKNMTKELGTITDAAPFKDRFIKATPAESRAALLPFLWGTVAKQGIIIGNRDKGSECDVANPHWVSYPGYSEVLCGHVDEKITDNRKRPNPNRNVFEWLQTAKPGYENSAVAFTTWDVFPFIFNTERNNIPVDTGLEPFTAGKRTDKIDFINRLRNEIPKRWSGSHFDAVTYHMAREWTAANKPRLIFLGLGETDEWAHESHYGDYLTSAHRDDGWLAEYWSMLQRDPFYRDCTSMIITCDHGRGDQTTDPKDWANHNAKTVGASQTWIAIIGPDTPADGEAAASQPSTAGPGVTKPAPLKSGQIAATIASLLGENYPAAEPRAMKPLPGVRK